MKPNKDNPNNCKLTEYGAKRDISPKARLDMYNRLYNVIEKSGIKIEPKKKEGKKEIKWHFKNGTMFIKEEDKKELLKRSIDILNQGITNNEDDTREIHGISTSGIRGFISEVISHDGLIIPTEISKVIDLSAYKINFLSNILSIETDLFSHYCVPAIDGELYPCYADKGYSYNRYKELSNKYNKVEIVSCYMWQR